MRLTFLGAAMMVTGSSYLIETADRKILVDCGMFQGGKAISDLNRRPFSYEPASIDCVLLTHAHIDHSGLLPKLCKEGFKGPIYTTRVTRDLCGIMLPDSAHIQEFDAEIANRKGKRAGKKVIEPLYTIDDAQSCLRQFAQAQYDERIELFPGIIVCFRNAGHILGSGMLEIWVTEENTASKLVFSGDLGQPDQPIIKDPDFIETTDYLIIESTYGNRVHERNDKEEVLAQIINETVGRGGNLVIPAFAVGRTQTLLYYLRKLLQAKKIPNVPVFIDSPMAIAATDVFLRYPEEFDSEANEMIQEERKYPIIMSNLHLTKTSEESKAINSLDQPAIIISASGMADAGRVLHHLKHNLWRPESSVLLVGYQAQGSLGRRLLDGVKRVTIMGEQIKVNASIYNLDGFSAHADQEQLLHWLAHFTQKPANIFIVHGEYDMSEPFSRLITERFQIPTYIPQYGDAALINGRDWTIEESKVAVVDPVVRKLREYLRQIDEQYVAYRRRIERLAHADSSKAADMVRRLERLERFMRNMLDEI